LAIAGFLENCLNRLLILSHDASKTGMTMPSGYISTHRRHRSFDGCGFHILRLSVNDIAAALSKLHFKTNSARCSKRDERGLIAK
jgi:hypothetical protein